MRALNLDFEQTAPGRLSYALLAAGLALLLAVGGYRYRLDADIARIEADAEQVSPAIARVTVSKDQSQEIEQANKVINRIVMPWEALFTAFENAANKNVALLAVEPDAQQGRLRVTAEAKSPAAMLAYVEALQQQAMLREVVLLNHEIQQDVPLQPLRFELAARWNL